MRAATIAVLLLLAGNTGWSQVFGGNSPSTRWQRLKQSSFSVVFPRGHVADAARVSTIIGRINQQNDSSSGTKRRFLHIVLQRETTVSNGYVALAPFRSEFMLTPPADPFDQGSTPWIDQLALHEYRHAEQYSNFNRGGARLFSFLLGQQGQAFANALTVPDWFFEGDAVYQETRYSAQGRGRLASFFNGYRSLWESNRNYSLAKLRNGSLKDYVPGHYDLGYQLVAYGYEKYGASFWKNISLDAAAMKGVFYPWQKAVGRYTGQRYRDFIQDALQRNRTVMQVPDVAAGKSAYADAFNPVYTETGSLLHTRASFSAVPAFYEKTGDHLHRIRTRDRSTDNYFSYSNGSIVYASFRPDIRWGWKNYSELQLLNTATGKQTTITRKSKYFSPALSVTGDSIIAVYNQPGEAVALHLLNREGKLLQTWPAATGELYYHPVFAGGNIVAAVRDAGGRMALVAISVTGERTFIVPWQASVIGYPKPAGEFVYFTAGYQARDRLFRIHIDGSNRQLLENEASLSQTGQYQPAVSGDTLTWMQFTADGTRLHSARIQATDAVLDSRAMNADPLLLTALTEAHSLLYPEAATEEVPVERYPKSKGLLHPHSWLPWFDGEEFSFDLMSENILNTLVSDLYLGYNRNEGYKKVGVSGSYGAWFPVITTGFSYTIDRRAYANGKSVYWNETEVPVNIQLPLNLSRGRFLRYLSLYSGIVFNQARFQGEDRQRYGAPAYQYLNHQLAFSNQVQQAPQQFNPSFAQSLRVHYRNAISRFSSRQLLLAGNFYFPGLAKNHSLVVAVGVQGRDSTDGIRFSNEMGLARGYTDENFFRAGSGRINYAFPLCYPDVGAFGIIYLLRLRANLFYDHSIAKDRSIYGDSGRHIYRSAGVEIMADTKWWNQLPVSLGIRYAYLADQDAHAGRNRFELIVPVNLLPGSINKR